MLTANVRIVVKYVLVSMEIRDFFSPSNLSPLLGMFIWCQENGPRHLFSALIAWQTHVPKRLLCFQTHPFSLLLLPADHILLAITNLTEFLNYVTWHDKGLSFRKLDWMVLGFSIAEPGCDFSWWEKREYIRVTRSAFRTRTNGMQNLVKK